MKMHSAVSAMVIVASLVRASFADSENGFHLTTRFYSRGNTPGKIESFAMSPDGSTVAIATSNTDVAAVRVADGEVIGRDENRNYRGLSFSKDGSQLLTFTESEIRLYDARSMAKIKQVNRFSDTPGIVGMQLEQRNGKLMVTKLTPGTTLANAGKIQVGDEIVGVAEGLEPEKARVDSETEWKDTIGWSADQAIRAISGRPGTWVRLKYIPKGKLEPETLSLQRARPYTPRGGKEMFATFLFPEGERVSVLEDRGAVVFRNSPTAIQIGALRPVNLRPTGAWILSDDCTLFAIAGPYRGYEGGLGIEVFSVIDGKLLAAAEIPANSAWCGTFSPDGKQLLIGTQDSVEVFDLSEKKWIRQIPFFVNGERDKGVATRGRVAGGFGLEGDAFLQTAPTTIFTKPAQVHRVALSRTGLLAAGGGDGVVRIVDFETARPIKAFPRIEKEGGVELVAFTPDGKRLLYFVRGTLHIVDVANLGLATTSEKE
jgi:hypothetical protein